MVMQTVSLRRLGQHSKCALAPEEPNVYRLRGQLLFGAPAERNELIDEYPTLRLF